MGSIGIAPELNRQEYGKAILDYSLEKATDMGFGAVLFEGNIGFYGHSGFDYASKFGIRYHDLPEDADVEEFDKNFPPKEKLKLPGQIFE